MGGIETRGPSPDEMGLKPKQVEDMEAAEVGAYGEKPLRDEARKGDVIEDEKRVLDAVAQKRGEQAMKEYAAEKEKNPVERFRAKITQVAAELRKKGLEQDAVIVEKVLARLEEFRVTLRARKQALEERWGKRVTIEQLQQAPSPYGVGDQITVTDQIGQGGGHIDSKDGFPSNQWFGDASDIEKYKMDEAAKKSGGEIVNYSMSKEGEEHFLRSLGVLQEGDELIDLPTRARINNPQSFDVTLPTSLNREGVRLFVKKEKERVYDTKPESRIAFELDNTFLEQLAKQQR